MKRLSRSALVLLFDLLAACAAWVATYFLRFNFEWPAEYQAQIAFGLLVLLPVHAIVCTRAGLYRGIWVFASLPDLARVLRAVAISSLAVWAFVALYRGAPGVPRSTLILYPMLLVLIMAGGRAAYRMWKEHRLYGGLIAKGKPVVVVGAGRGGAMLLRELQRSPDWRVIGLVDDDAEKWGRELLGLPVLGPVKALPEILVAERVEHVILAMPSAATKVRRAATDLAVRAGAKVFTVPGLEDVMAGRVAVSSIRRVDIEDLLGREPVWIDTPHVEAMLKDKVVLVTGAGGSIGSELCHQLARFAPRRVVLYELNEFALYNVEQWFSSHAPGIDVVPLAGDVKDAARLAEVFAAWRPEVVFHAAAYKHVPLMEVANAWQAVRNNVLGTLRVGEAAQRHGAERFILISTDKAVNPTNVMGASKRLAELVCQALHQRAQGTQFEMVRFGNVLGSTGSVIPKFQEQIARGGPITVTHPEINRYFMSIPEAAQLVLQAAAMGQGGEIFVMDMGDPVKIVDLARNMIRLSGYSEEEIRIEFTGLRPGEKLYEELLADSEETRETPHPKLRIARSVPAASSFLAELAGWFAQKDCLGDDEVRRALLRWVPEYVPMGGRPALRIVESESKLARVGDRA
ncbi:nucleoside-diphosphate sugar epimerase/dehydratase [Aromatoleum evansii]|uniref:Nucleoside-diphosphate sugar epimerase/dehydratase n=1 Tax=Aromatoleum evansii TaxID=59406 RepID=A0ABZ1AJN7_AROEV|nr:nucleoside-diphosphate sugar epimerase/dehydratase [Aromatoleum evansii]